MPEQKNHNKISVTQKVNNLGIALFVFLALAGTILWLSGNLHFGPADSAQTDVAAVDEHEDEHENESAADVTALEEARCEHGIQTIECDQCRFEVGVVKLHPSVAEALIETAVVRDTPKTKILKLTGQVRFDKTKVVDVVPTGSGRVNQVIKLLGQDVEKADALATITSGDLGQAKAAFLETQARLNLATTTFDREKELYEKKVSSKADYLNALNELRAAEAYYTAAEKRLRLFGLSSEQIEAAINEK